MEFLFLGTSRGPERRMVEEFGMPYQAIPAGKLRRYWDWKNLSDPFLVLAGFFTEFLSSQVSSADRHQCRQFCQCSCGLGVDDTQSSPSDPSDGCQAGLANRLMKPCSNAAAFYFESTLNTFKGFKRGRWLDRWSEATSSTAIRNERRQNGVLILKNLC